MAVPSVILTLPRMAMAAVFNLNHHATYLHWHFINVSLSNVLVVAVMLAVFALAILLPFPGRHATGAAIAPPPASEE